MLQPAVIIAAAKAQAIARLVIAHGGDQDQVNLVLGQDGAGQVGLGDAEGDGHHGPVRHVLADLHQVAGQHPGQSHSLALGDQGLDHAGGLRLLAGDAPKGKDGLGLLHLGQS